jgi:hypothetical protein
VKQKENIFEELGRMKSLIHAKAGVVISEQATNPATDIATIKAEMGRGFANSDEQKVVDVLKKYTTDKATFKNFLNQYKTVTGAALTDELPKQFQPDRDQGEIRDLNASLNKLGITFEVKLSDDRRRFVATFLGLDTPAAAPAAGTRTPEAMKNITSTFCGVRGGKITAGAFKDKPWTDYKTTYKVTDAEEQEAKKSCPTVQVGSGSGQRSGQSSVNNRFASSVKSLGIQGDKMDLQTLQSILNTLEGGQSTAAATGTPAAATTGTPDIAQLTAALNQLQA